MNWELTTVSGFIQEIGLRLAVQKTEAVLRKALLCVLQSEGRGLAAHQIRRHLVWREVVFPGTPKASSAESRSSNGQAQHITTQRRRITWEEEAARKCGHVGSIVWCPSIGIAYRREEMERVQRKVRLRYHTILAPTVNILAGISPPEIKIAEIAESYRVTTPPPRNLRERS